jgi:hypothetical protein
MLKRSYIKRFYPQILRKTIVYGDAIEFGLECLIPDSRIADDLPSRGIFVALHSNTV